MQPVRHSWFKAYTEKDEFDGNISLTFYQCDDENPPTRKVKETEDAIRPLGTLCCDLGVSLSDLPSHTGTHGKRYRKLSYEVELVPSGASVEFVLYFQGERKGSEKVKIRGVKMRFS
jgi:hypothetical protein